MCWTISWSFYSQRVVRRQSKHRLVGFSKKLRANDIPDKKHRRGRRNQENQPDIPPLGQKKRRVFSPMLERATSVSGEKHVS